MQDAQKDMSHFETEEVSYEDFPWFKDQAVKAIINVEEQSPGHFYWPDIDVDLTSEIIEHPEKHSLKAGNT